MKLIAGLLSLEPAGVETSMKIIQQRTDTYLTLMKRHLQSMFSSLLNC